jgi:RHS repeat-associated protein
MCKVDFFRDDYRYGFNGQEKDDEIKGTGNSLDFGARIYDSRLGRFLSLDPLMTKYPSESPLSFVGNSPLIFIDPDGKEKVIVIGSLDRNHGKDAFKFINSAMGKANELQSDNVKNQKNEQITIILCTAHMNTDEVTMNQKAIMSNCPGVNVVVANNKEEVVNYINSKDLINNKLSKNREADKISLLNFYSHGSQDQIGLGMFSAEESKWSFGSDQINLVKKGAFELNSTVNIFACNSEFMAKKFSSKTGSIATGFNGQCDYASIYGGIRIRWGKQDNARYLFDNKKTEIQPANDPDHRSDVETKTYCDGVEKK